MECDAIVASGLNSSNNPILDHIIHTDVNALFSNQICFKLTQLVCLVIGLYWKDIKISRWLHLLGPCNGLVFDCSRNEHFCLIIIYFEVEIVGYILKTELNILRLRFIWS